MSEFGDARLPGRFWDKAVELPDGCWAWSGALNSHGYGAFWMDGRQVGAHQAAYEALVGQVGDQMHIDHLCRTRNCVNPSHMEAVTCRENILRGQTRAAENAEKTRCDHGHPLAGENLYVVPKTGARVCRQCSRDRQMRRPWCGKCKRRHRNDEGPACVPKKYVRNERQA